MIRCEEHRNQTVKAEPQRQDSSWSVGSGIRNSGVFVFALLDMSCVTEFSKCVRLSSSVSSGV